MMSKVRTVSEGIVDIAEVMMSVDADVDVEVCVNRIRGGDGEGFLRHLQSGAETKVDLPASHADVLQTDQF